MTHIKASLRYWHKARILDRYILEMEIYREKRSEKYKEGVKYRIVCLDTRTTKRVLMDNHYPKGHHIHVDDKEIKSEFVNEEKLIEEFKQIVREYMGVKL